MAFSLRQVCGAECPPPVVALDMWLGNVIASAEKRVLRLVSWGTEFTRDFGIPIFLSELCRALHLLEPEVQVSILHDSTSPGVVLLCLREELLHCGLEDVGRIPIHEHMWDSIFPKDF